MNQAILAPAVIHLNLFMTKSPEKETYMNAGDWKIRRSSPLSSLCIVRVRCACAVCVCGVCVCGVRLMTICVCVVRADINFQKDGRVTVRHSKWEKTKDSSFKWHLKMTLNDSLSMLEDASFAFPKLRFPATEAGEARKRAFLDYIGTQPRPTGLRRSLTSAHTRTRAHTERARTQVSTTRAKRGSRKRKERCGHGPTTSSPYTRAWPPSPSAPPSRTSTRGVRGCGCGCGCVAHV